MTEPVAYIYEDHVFKTEKEAVLFKKEFDRYKHDGMLKHVILPLFTADEISDIYRQNNRVEMTQAEFDEFNKLLLSSAVTIYEVIDTIYEDNGEMNNFSHLYQRLFNRNDKLELENQLEFSKLWANYNPDNPEETIEIVPEMKWFVRSKQPDNSSGHYHFRSGVKHFADYYYAKDKNDNKKAYAFDTKEEAELWTNPLTEAVQLPVEGE